MTGHFLEGTVDVCRFEVIRCGIGKALCVARPVVFLAGRTVGYRADKVRLLRTDRVFIESVEKHVRGREAARTRVVGREKQRRYVAEGQRIGKSRYFDILEAVIY